MRPPPPRSTMWRAAARLHTNVPFRLTDMTRSHSFSSRSTTGTRSLPPRAPALLTRMSILPNASTACCMAASTDAESVTSQVKASERRPSPSISPCNAGRPPHSASGYGFSTRSVTTTSAPSSASRCAMPRPDAVFAPGAGHKHGFPRQVVHLSVLQVVLYTMGPNGRLAQLVRAIPLQGIGRRFESVTAHQQI